jgi:uncharacterized protein
METSLRVLEPIGFRMGPNLCAALCGETRDPMMSDRADGAVASGVRAHQVADRQRYQTTWVVGRGTGALRFMGVLALVCLTLSPNPAFGLDLDRALVAAAGAGRLVDVENLLAMGVAPCALDEKGASAVQRAAELSSLDLVSLACGRVRRDPVRGRGRSSTWVCEPVYNDIVLAMVDAGLTAPERREDERLDEELVAASMHGEDERIPSLLRQGADANAKHKARPALVWAAFWGHREAVQRLLEGSADQSLTDSAGLTALEWAERGGYEGIADLLRRAATTQPEGVGIGER